MAPTDSVSTPGREGPLNVIIRFEPLELSLKEQSRKKKKGEKKSGTAMTALEFTSTNEEPAAEEAAVEGDFAGLPVHNCLRIQVTAN